MTWTFENGVLRADGLKTAAIGKLGWAKFTVKAKKANLEAFGKDWITSPTADALAEANAKAQTIADRGIPKMLAGFVRFGDLPDGGKSRHWGTGAAEKGVSALYAQYDLENGHWIASPSSLPVELYSTVTARIPYLLSGKVVGLGSDDEPLLKNAKILATLKYRGGGVFEVANYA